MMFRIFSKTVRAPKNETILVNKCFHAFLFLVSLFVMNHMSIYGYLNKNSVLDIAESAKIDYHIFEKSNRFS